MASNHLGCAREGLPREPTQSKHLCTAIGKGLKAMLLDKMIFFT